MLTPHTTPIQQLSTSGLTTAQADTALMQHGRNRLRPPERSSVLRRFLSQFHNVLIYVLLASSIVTALIGHITDSLVILSVIAINALIGFIQEGKAEKSLEALRQMLSLHAQVMRDGTLVTIDAELLVPGDVVFVQAGDKIPADIRLLQSDHLKTQEAALTGESQSVDKNIDAVAADAPLAERSCMLYAGTYVVKGQGSGVVIATADHTEIGKISTLLHTVENSETPLMRRMNQMAKKLTIIILLCSFALFVFGVLVRGLSYEQMFMAVIGIAVSAIPEGLPAVITITLAIGVQRMVRKNAIVRKLASVESLGSVDVICTDKTGTLTRNELSVSHVVTADALFEVTGTGYAPEGQVHTRGQKVMAADDPVLHEISLACLLNNDAELNLVGGEYKLTGDPTEGALLAFSLKVGHDKVQLRNSLPRLNIIPFDASYAFMATLHRHSSGKAVVYIKGAPEKLLAMCEKQMDGKGKISPIQHDYWQKQLHMLAEKGERVLAVAYQLKPQGDHLLEFAGLQQGMVLLGLTGISDAPREEAKTSIAACYKAGIAVKMITGDHAITASAIGRDLGIQNSQMVLTGKELETLSDSELAHRVADVNIYARATPVHKLRLITALQSRGHVVAMTGDGVNDAPALKKADIGVAMGKNGTEVAKEAAGMVLIDDNFATIVHAIEEGRVIFNNIRKSIAFMLATDIPEAGVIILAILLGLTQLPISPVQILWVNMVTSVTLSMALSVEPGTADIMNYPPRKQNSPFFGKAMVLQSVFVALCTLAGTLGLFLWEVQQGAPYAVAQTIAVNTLVMFQVFYLLAIAHRKQGLFHQKSLTDHPYVLLSIAVVLILQLIFTYAPFMQAIFSTAALEMRHWGSVVLVSGSVYVLLSVLRSK